MHDNHKRTTTRIEWVLEPWAELELPDELARGLM
jgi:hypothetical protein